MTSCFLDLHSLTLHIETVYKLPGCWLFMSVSLFYLRNKEHMNVATVCDPESIADRHHSREPAAWPHPLSC